jgi:hypothetical protein
MITALSLRQGHIMSRRQHIQLLKIRANHDKMDHAFTMIRCNWAAKTIQNFVRRKTQLLSKGFIVL